MFYIGAMKDGSLHRLPRSRSGGFITQKRARRCAYLEYTRLKLYNAPGYDSVVVLCNKTQVCHWDLPKLPALGEGFKPDHAPELDFPPDRLA